MAKRADGSLTVLVFAPFGRDAALLETGLQKANIACTTCTSPESFAEKLEQPLGAVFLTAEALSEGVSRDLDAALAAQPAWSALPVLLMTEVPPVSPSLQPSYAIPLARPSPFGTVLAAIKLALSVRQRQYDIRDLVVQLERLNRGLATDAETFQNAAQRASERFAVAFHTSPTPTAILRQQDAVLVNVNDSFADLSGYRTDELVGAEVSTFDLMAGGMWRKALKSETPFESRLKTKSDELRHCLVQGVELEVAGAACRLVTLINMTERKQNEAQLREAIDRVLRDTSWFSQSVLEHLSDIKQKTLVPKMTVKLTRRERQVLALIAQGLANKQIAKRLELTPNTVRNYTKNLYQKLDIHSRAEAMLWARERGVEFRED